MLGSDLQEQDYHMSSGGNATRLVRLGRIGLRVFLK